MNSYEKPVIKYINAPEGYFAVFPCKDESGVTVDLDEVPIVAFQVSDEVALKRSPDTLEHSVITIIKYVTDEDIYSDCYLKRPNGAYVDPQSCWFSSREQLIEHINSMRK